MVFWEVQDEALLYFKGFQGLISQVFEHTPLNGEASTRLFSISQGNRCAADYALEFRMQAARSSWNEPVLKAMFHHRLNEEVLTEMAYSD